MSLSIRADVRIHGLRPEALLAVIVANDVCRDHSYDCQLSGGIEGIHSRTSLHYAGLAFDFTVGGIPNGAIALVEYQRITNKLATALGPDYDVLLETTRLHIHVEYQPKRGYRTETVVN